jgi:hypothetical protein
LEITSASLVVCRLAPGQPIPGWAFAGDWWSVSRSEAELSIVCEERWVPEGVVHSGPWRALGVEGPLDHALIGVLASIADPLARAQIPIFVISTYDTDWVLVPEGRVAQAGAALLAAGHELTAWPSDLGRE